MTEVARSSVVIQLLLVVHQIATNNGNSRTESFVKSEHRFTTSTIDVLTDSSRFVARNSMACALKLIVMQRSGFFYHQASQECIPAPVEFSYGEGDDGEEKDWDYWTNVQPKGIPGYNSQTTYQKCCECCEDGDVIKWLIDDYCFLAKMDARVLKSEGRRVCSDSYWGNLAFITLTRSRAMLRCFTKLNHLITPKLWIENTIAEGFKNQLFGKREEGCVTNRSRVDVTTSEACVTINSTIWWCTSYVPCTDKYGYVCESHITPLNPIFMV